MPKGKGYGINTKSTYRRAMKSNSKKGINYTLKSSIGECINSPRIKRMAGQGSHPVSTKGRTRTPARK